MSTNTPDSSGTTEPIARAVEIVQTVDGLERFPAGQKAFAVAVVAAILQAASDIGDSLSTIDTTIYETGRDIAINMSGGAS